MLGQTLGHYSVLEKIGAGGMGEVYRARDEHLGRDVALKFLPEVFASDVDRLARFEREARLLAALNNPHIAAIHGLGEHDGKRFLVLELVPGQTLAEKLAAGPLTLEEALHVVSQMAEGLEAAHDRGIIHRDLKPANVKVTPDGEVKILDFGIATVMLGSEAPVVNPLHSPTTIALSQGGIVLGTAAYMSPEQARGKVVGKRTDIWSFGCVLFEMLAGKKAFSGETVSDTIAAVLRGDPDWNALPDVTPPFIWRMLRRCLQKDITRRLRDIGDARLEVEEALAGGAEAGQLAANRSRLGAIVPWVALGLVTMLAVLGVWSQLKITERPTVSRFTISSPPGESLLPYEYPILAVSPDGRRIAFVTQRGNDSRLYIRDIDALGAKPVPASEGAAGPFFSPDGQWIGFFAGGYLKKAPVNGGLPLSLCAAPVARGASWAPDNSIIFAPVMGSGLKRVSAAGGTPEIISTLNVVDRERTHRWPEVLPGGQAVMFTSGTLDSPEYFLDARIAVQSLKDKRQRKVIIQGGSQAHYVAGYVIYAGPGGLFSVPFDLHKLEVKGPPVRVLEDVATDVSTGAAQFSVSQNGSLAYVPGGTTSLDRKLVWVDRQGKVKPVPAPTHNYLAARLSPDGGRIATVIGTAADSEVWVYDLRRGTLTRLTTEQGNKMGPLWSPDGKRIVYGSATRGQGMVIVWKPADGSGSAQPLMSTVDSPMLVPGSWSPDGKTLLLDRLNPESGFDIWLLPIGQRTPQVFLETPFSEQWAVFSPDGRWVSYVSEESGRAEVYIRPFSSPGTRLQISNNGGMQPAWARSGKELFYRTADQMMVVAMETKPQLKASTPRLVFHGHFDFSDYDVTADGSRFLMIQGHDDTAPTQFNVVLNWRQEWNQTK